MKTYDNKIIVQGIMVLAFASIILFITYLVFNYQNVPDYSNDTFKYLEEIDNKLEKMSNTKIKELEFADEVVKRFAENHQYSSDYNCVNYSNDLQELGSHLGMKFRTQTGYNNVSGHRWLSYFVDIEPQKSKLVNYDKKYQK